MVDDFIERKHGRKKVEYDHPSLEPILKDTYGVIVYQEQVMQISSALAGYSLGKADLLRRAMGKKKAEVMAKEKAGFLDGAKQKGIDPKIAERVFDLMEKFAGYGFNRSHSAAYGLLTYQTAYLKRYYPVEFFAALLTCDKDDTDAVVKFIAEAKADGIAVLRPDVNESDTDFSVVAGPWRAGQARRTRAPTKESKASTKEARKAADEQSSSSTPTSSPTRTTGDRKVIRFGLGAVKGVGEGAVEVIKQARAQGGPLPLPVRLLQARRRAQGEPQGDRGAGQGGRLRRHRRSRTASRRARVFGAIGLASERAAEAQRDRESGQTSLLALFGGGGGNQEQRAAGDGAKTSTRRRRVDARRSCSPTKRRALGFYISGHPLDRFASEIRRFTNATAANCFEKGERAEVILAGVVAVYPGADHEERQRQVRLLHARRPTAARSSSSSTRRRSSEYREILSRTIRCW